MYLMGLINNPWGDRLLGSNIVLHNPLWYIYCIKERNSLSSLNMTDSALTICRVGRGTTY